MCVVSMIMDHFHNKWDKLTWPHKEIYPWQPQLSPLDIQLPSKEEIEEFRKLLERAREYDKRNSEPDCELEEKKQKIRDLAKELGIEIDFI